MNLNLNHVLFLLYMSLEHGLGKTEYGSVVGVAIAMFNSIVKRNEKFLDKHLKTKKPGDQGEKKA